MTDSHHDDEPSDSPIEDDLPVDITSDDPTARRAWEESQEDETDDADEKDTLSWGHASAALPTSPAADKSTPPSRPAALRRPDRGSSTCPKTITFRATGDGERLGVCVTSRLGDSGDASISRTLRELAPPTSPASIRALHG